MSWQSGTSLTHVIILKIQIGFNCFLIPSLILFLILKQMGPISRCHVPLWSLTWTLVARLIDHVVRRWGHDQGNPN